MEWGLLFAGGGVLLVLAAGWWIGYRLESANRRAAEALRARDNAGQVAAARANAAEAGAAAYRSAAAAAARLDPRAGADADRARLLLGWGDSGGPGKAPPSGAA